MSQRRSHIGRPNQDREGENLTSRARPTSWNKSQVQVKISITGKKGKKKMNLFIRRVKEELIQVRVTGLDQEGRFKFRSMIYDFMISI